jgi:NAD dependent epimerase/dehydratase family enzyme
MSCLGREDAFRAASAARRTPVTLARLNYAVDLRYGVLVDIAEKVMRGEPVGVSTGFVNVIWQGDALAHIIQSLSLAASPPAVLNITGPRTLGVRALAEAVGHLLGKPVTTTGVESETAWLSDASRAHHLFGRPRVPEETLLHWVAGWLAGGGETLGKPTRFEVRDGKF